MQEQTSRHRSDVQELQEELEEEMSRHRIDVQELEGMQEAMLTESERLEQSELQSTSQCDVLQQRVLTLEQELEEERSRLVSELEEEKSRRRIDVQELEGMQEAMLTESERLEQSELQSTSQCGVLQQRVIELEVELEEEKSRHRIDVQELESMQEAMLKELGGKDTEIKQFEEQQQHYLDCLALRKAVDDGQLTVSQLRQRNLCMQGISHWKLECHQKKLQISEASCITVAQVAPCWWHFPFGGLLIQ